MQAAEEGLTATRSQGLARLSMGRCRTVAEHPAQTRLLRTCAPLEGSLLLCDRLLALEELVVGARICCLRRHVRYVLVFQACLRLLLRFLKRFPFAQGVCGGVTSPLLLADLRRFLFIGCLLLSFGGSGAGGNFAIDRALLLGLQLALAQVNLVDIRDVLL